MEKERERRQHNGDMASGGLKVGTFPTGVFRNILFSFFSFTYTFFLVFCNFNLAAKYSWSVLSMTASQSPGLTPYVKKTGYSLCSVRLFLSFCVCFSQTLRCVKGLE